VRRSSLQLAGRKRRDGVLCSVHVTRRQPCGCRLLLYFTPHNTPPPRFCSTVAVPGVVRGNQERH
jgi:hypothetical protein